MPPGAKHHLPSLPSPKTGPQTLTVGASEEEAGSSRASRGNSDAGDPQRLRTRGRSLGTEDAAFHADKEASRAS